MKSSALAILLGKPKGSDDAEETEDGEDGETDTMDEGLKASAREVIDAVKADDDEALATALKSFIEQC